MNQFLFLKQAAKKVPSLKYAIGILGIAYAIAFFKTLNIGDVKIPILGICIFLLLMLLLWLFSNLATSKDKHHKNAGYILTYSAVIIISITCILFMTSVFFNFPKPIIEYSFFKVDSIQSNHSKQIINFDQVKSNNVELPKKNNSNPDKNLKNENVNKQLQKNQPIKQEIVLKNHKYCKIMEILAGSILREDLLYNVTIFLICFLTIIFN